MIVGIDPIVLTVADLERTRSFYTRVMGMSSRSCKTEDAPRL